MLDLDLGLWHMRCGAVTEYNMEAKMKEEDMIRSIIPELLVGGEVVCYRKHPKIRPKFLSRFM